MGLITSLIDPDSSSNGGGGGLIGAIKRRSSGSSNSSDSADPDNYKRGGKVKKTGMAKVHKGEKVLTKKQAKRYQTKSRGR